MKRTLLFLAACSARPSFDPLPHDASAFVSCETTTTCTLECTKPTSWTTTECKTTERSACADGYESSTAYGCVLECGRITHAVATCNGPSSSR